jgi:phosphotransferase system HPr-like phosphotransfer protein
MRICNVQLNALGDIQKFVNAAGLYEAAIDMVSGRYVIDAKSLLGVLTLDLSKPVELRIYGDHPENFLEAIRPYLAA